MVIMEPVQNAGGVFPPPKGYFQGVREICDEHGILLCADEVITRYGRLGSWFGSEKYDIRPDMITRRQGPVLGVRVDRRGHRDRQGRRAVPDGHEHVQRTASRSAGTPSMCAIASKNLEIMKRERIVEHVAETGHGLLADARRSCSTCRSSATSAATGFFYAHRARQGQGDQGVASPTRSPRRCCATSSRRGCSRPA